MTLKAVVFDRTNGAGPAEHRAPSEQRKMVLLAEPLDEPGRWREAIKSAIGYLSQPVHAVEDALAVLQAAVRKGERSESPQSTGHGHWTRYSRVNKPRKP